MSRFTPEIAQKLAWALARAARNLRGDIECLEDSLADAGDAVDPDERHALAEMERELCGYTALLKEVGKVLLNLGPV